ncbi:hypothetical protein PCANC_23730 [Puccinia coronata f. sp. avenae]|uniref:Uncharacterized protein n=1 Tax=Puccinia coronata f. sp. avenae TaxID=200324 RepID=A0A2N5SC71_9BASI|nr:hypothetical protein PCANC_23730 [Puccinia coronata f. sp. avenae]
MKLLLETSQRMRQDPQRKGSVPRTEAGVHRCSWASRPLASHRPLFREWFTVWDFLVNHPHIEISPKLQIWTDSSSPIAMKLTTMLLLIMTELVIICRGSYWDTLEAHGALSDNWSGEAHQQLIEGINRQFQSTSHHDPYEGISNNEISRIARVPLLDRIRLRKKEKNVHQLVFHKNVFKIPDSLDELHNEKKKLFEQIFDQRQRESHSGSNPCGFLLKGDEVRPFSQNFKRVTTNPPERAEKIPKPSALLPKELNKFFSSLKIWMNVYHKRLGIDFTAVQKWTTETLLKEPIMPPPETANMIKDFFISYLFFVDTIITILPETSGHVVNRIEAFRTAVTCFEKHTDKLVPQQQLSLLNLKSFRLQLLWSYLEHWLTQDENYKLQAPFWDGNKKESQPVWKTVFNFILLYSIDSLNTEKKTELEKSGEIL